MGARYRRPIDPRRHVTVLHIPPITSAVLAVKAAIVEEFKSGEPRRSLRKIGRPKLPKGEAKGKIMLVRFTASRNQGNRSSGEGQ